MGLGSGALLSLWEKRLALLPVWEAEDQRQLADSGYQTPSASFRWGFVGSHSCWVHRCGRKQAADGKQVSGREKGLGETQPLRVRTAKATLGPAAA